MKNIHLFCNATFQFGISDKFDKKVPTDLYFEIKEIIFLKNPTQYPPMKWKDKLILWKWLSYWIPFLNSFFDRIE